jgi:DNA-binding transcriptional MerR regulator
MDKTAQAFKTISEVAQDLDLPQHVLRFWETRFVQIRPLKRGGGRRYYRPEDIDLLRAIRQLLYGQGYTIKGVQKILKEQGARGVAANYGGAEALIAESLPEGLNAGVDDRAADLLEPVPPHDGEASREPLTGRREAAAPQVTQKVLPQVQIPPDPRQAWRRIKPQLTPADSRVLQELLLDLIDCARILDAARGG